MSYLQEKNYKYWTFEDYLDFIFYDYCYYKEKSVLRALLNVFGVDFYEKRYFLRGDVEHLAMCIGDRAYNVDIWDEDLIFLGAMIFDVGIDEPVMYDLEDGERVLAVAYKEENSIHLYFKRKPSI